ncbi:MAG: hypothetical protein WBL16_08050, partial [Zwartia sp.]
MNDYSPFISSSINDTIGSLYPFYSELLLIIGFLLVILADLFFSKKYPQYTYVLTLLTLLATGVLNFQRMDQEPVPLFGGMIVLDHLAVLFKILFCFIGILFVLFVRYHKALQDHSKGIGDLFSILLALQLGLNLMVMSQNLLMAYLSLEMVSVGSYLMVGY